MKRAPPPWLGAPPRPFPCCLIGGLPSALTGSQPPLPFGPLGTPLPPQVSPGLTRGPGGCPGKAAEASVLPGAPAAARRPRGHLSGRSGAPRPGPESEVGCPPQTPAEMALGMVNTGCVDSNHPSLNVKVSLGSISGKKRKNPRIPTYREASTCLPAFLRPAHRPHIPSALLGRSLHTGVPMPETPCPHGAEARRGPQLRSLDGLMEEIPTWLVFSASTATCLT